MIILVLLRSNTKRGETRQQNIALQITIRAIVPRGTNGFVWNGSRSPVGRGRNFINRFTCLETIAKSDDSIVCRYRTNRIFIVLFRVLERPMKMWPVLIRSRKNVDRQDVSTSVDWFARIKTGCSEQSLLSIHYRWTKKPDSLQSSSKKNFKIWTPWFEKIQRSSQ